MNDQEATRIVANLKNAVIATHPGPIRQAFSALAALDADRVTQRAAQVLADIDHTVLTTLRQAGDDPQQRLTMEVFDASLLEYLQDKPAEVESSVVHDIPTWIEANAAAVAAANIKIMEAALPAEEPSQAHRTLIEFHQHIDFAAFENEQNAALQRAWSTIEAQIEDFLAHAPEAGNGVTPQDRSG